MTSFYQKEHASGQKVSIRETAEEFGTTILKIRKIPITAGVFHSEISEKVQELFSCGKTIEEIQTELELSRASVYSYLPYVKKSIIYKKLAQMHNVCRFIEAADRQCLHFKVL